jgi:hypothetical protein
VHTSAREHRNTLVAEKPGGPFGRVARVLILRRQKHERPFELLVQGREQERQGRLGHPRRRGERLGELAQPVSCSKLADERVEDRTVHDERALSMV